MNSNINWQEITEKVAEALLKSIAHTLGLHLHHRSAYIYGQTYNPEWALETTMQTKITEHCAVVVLGRRILINGKYIWTSPIDLLYAFVNTQYYYVPITRADRKLERKRDATYLTILNLTILNPFYGLTPKEIQIKIDLETVV